MAELTLEEHLKGKRKEGRRLNPRDTYIEKQAKEDRIKCEMKYQRYGRRILSNAAEESSEYDHLG